MAHENPNWKLSRVGSTGAVFVYAAGSTSDVTDDMLYDDVLSGDEKNVMTGTTDNATEGEIETTPEDIVQSIEVDEYDIVCTKDEEGNLPLHEGVTLWGDEGTFPQLPFPPAVGRSQLDDPSVETIDTPMGDGGIEESNFGIMNSASSGTDWRTFCEQLVRESDISPKNIPCPAWLKTNVLNKSAAQKPMPRPVKPRPADQRTDSGTSENARTLEELGKLERSPRHRVCPPFCIHVP